MNNKLYFLTTNALLFTNMHERPLLEPLLQLCSRRYNESTYVIDYTALYCILGPV